MFIEDVLNGFRSSHQRGSAKISVLSFSQNSQKNTCARVTFQIKLQGPDAYNFIEKETLAQVFFCEFCEIFKNKFFTEHVWVTTLYI